MCSWLNILVLSLSRTIHASINAPKYLQLADPDTSDPAQADRPLSPKHQPHLSYSTSHIRHSPPQSSYPPMAIVETQNQPKRIGIVGGGVAGLYAALLLQRRGHSVHIFEASNRVGGRIYTHRFTFEKNQYFEAGAMRIPVSPFHKILFDLVKYLNQQPELPSDARIELMPYILNNVGNFVNINGRSRIGSTLQTASAGATTPKDLGWDVPPEYQNISANALLAQAIGPLVERLKRDFDKEFWDIVKDFDSFSFRSYLRTIHNWPTSVIDFVETVTSQSNQFTMSVTELLMESMDFGTAQWMTIKDGMDRLPQAMAAIVGWENITLGARVVGFEYTSSSKVKILAFDHVRDLSEEFDKLLLAIPPASLKVMNRRPQFSLPKEVAIRSIHFQALYKIGLRFKTRFWEKQQGVLPPSRGGQSTTDLPIRWIVYPSYGIGDSGPGVLLLYAWMTDAEAWLPLGPDERRNLAVHCLSRVYPSVDIVGQLMDTFDVAWSARASTGDAKFLPGQFQERFTEARRPEGPDANTPLVFFAGEHLSKHHTWIAGALESGLDAVEQMLEEHVSPLVPVGYGIPDSAPNAVPESELGLRLLQGDPLAAGQALVNALFSQELQTASILAPTLTAASSVLPAGDAAESTEGRIAAPQNVALAA
ncbi:hypothetical protein K474DRAFT_1647054 [Panus rudis PR-1116 ss-1]|nr:hypothetical protein K474DRAFT_1647054 [Panus rudis PR-1116 ss-1]